MDIVYPRNPFYLLLQSHFLSWFLWHQGVNESKTVFSLISGNVFRSYRKWGHVEPKAKVWQYLKFFLFLPHNGSSFWMYIELFFFFFKCEEESVKSPMSMQLLCLPSQGFILFWYLCLQVSMHAFMWLCLSILSFQLKFIIFISHSISLIMISLIFCFLIFMISLIFYFNWHKQTVPAM